MASEMSKDPDERTTIISFRNVALNVGLIAGAAVAPRLIAAGETPRAGYELMGGVLALIIIISTIWLFFGTAKAPRNIKSDATLSLKEQLAVACDTGGRGSRHIATHQIQKSCPRRSLFC